MGIFGDYFALTRSYEGNTEGKDRIDERPFDRNIMQKVIDWHKSTSPYDADKLDQLKLDLEIEKSRHVGILKDLDLDITYPLKSLEPIIRIAKCYQEITDDLTQDLNKYYKHTDETPLSDAEKIKINEIARSYIFNIYSTANLQPPPLTRLLANDLMMRIFHLHDDQNENTIKSEFDKLLRTDRKIGGALNENSEGVMTYNMDKLQKYYDLLGKDELKSHVHAILSELNKKKGSAFADEETQKIMLTLNHQKKLPPVDESSQKKSRQSMFASSELLSKSKSFLKSSKERVKSVRISSQSFFNEPGKKEADPKLNNNAPKPLTENSSPQVEHRNISMKGPKSARDTIDINKPKSKK